MFDKTKKLINAIRTSHRLRDVRLDVKSFGMYHIYNAYEDVNYYSYLDARWVLCKYPKIEKILDFFGWI